MNIKRILVPLDASIYTEGATETACRIARTHGASVSGVAVLDSPEIRSSIVPAIGPYYPMMLDAVQEKLKHAEQVLQESLERFAKTCSDAGVKHAETEYEGIPAQKLLESSIFYDLVVSGLETSFHFETRGGRGDTIDQLLAKTATPILAVPPTGMKDPAQVVIAFDGSFGASRALRDFMLYAAPYRPDLTVISAGLEPAQSDFLLSNAARLLRAHGFDSVELVASDEEIENAIPESLRTASDLIVAGIHSRHKIKDFFVGSFTSKLIKQGDTALFLSH
ncbi:MAG: universal stress protein [Verrucomicrobiales bacterium]|nr:universal stress protein [Verrucomicrobiales bacterium]